LKRLLKYSEKFEQEYPYEDTLQVQSIVVRVFERDYDRSKVIDAKLKKDL
jgi:hypothetical protein